MGDAEAVEDCKVWLLKQKQTQDWKTTKATADAMYGLLLRGTDLLASDFHGRAHLEPYVVETRQWFEQRQLEAAFGDLAAGNPHRIMNDEMPMALPPLEVRTGALDRLKSLLNLKGTSS